MRAACVRERGGSILNHVKWFAVAMVVLAMGACAEDPPKFALTDGDAPAAGKEAASGNGGAGESSDAADPGGAFSSSPSGGAGNDGGAGAEAAERGDAGAGGATEEPECSPASVAADCAERECFVASCDAGQCQYEPVDSGTRCGPNAARFCDGAGECVECIQDAQCEADDICSAGDCTAEGTCAQQFRGVGESCDDGIFCNGDETCDGQGVCRPGNVRCQDPTVCDEDVRACVRCVSSSDCPAQTPVCSDESRCICTSDEHCAVADECRVGRCNLADGTCTTELRDSGTPCGSGATECSLQDTCNGAGACLPNHVAVGTIVHAASSSDCRQRTCDGLGTALETLVDEACDDGIFCTGSESCTAGGICQSTGDPCVAPRPFCVNTKCGECNADAQCAGLKGAGTGRCLGGSCYECTDATVATDCGGQETGCSGGRCQVTCNCSEEACDRQYTVLCRRK